MVEETGLESTSETLAGAFQAGGSRTLSHIYESPDLGYLPNPLSLWDSCHGSATETPGHFLDTVSPSPLSFFFKHIPTASLQCQESVFGNMVIAFLGRDGMRLVPFCL